MMPLVDRARALRSSLRDPLRDPNGAVYHFGAIAYAVAAYGLGLAGLFASPLWVNALATLLLAHAMTIAAYVVHECGHNTIFRNPASNTRLGRFMTWVCGAAYATLEDIRYKHFRHHVDVDDVVWFDYERFFRDHPRVLAGIRALEWLYIPAHDLLMHGILVFSSFVIPERRDQRERNLRVIAIRGGVYLGVAIFAPKAALLYAIAIMAMITVLRFMDSLQHDYGYHLTLFSKEPSQHKGDLEWEQEHTFSNPQSFDHEWLNWLTLNFGYHNAHHAKPITPWYRLPGLHRELFGNDPANVIPLGPQLRVFHRHRVARVLPDAAAEVSGEAPWGRGFLAAARRGAVIGGNAASFLTPF